MRDEILERVMELIALYLRLGDTKGTSVIAAGKIRRLENCSEENIFLRERLWFELKELLQKLHRL